MARNFDVLDMRNVLVNRLSWNMSGSGVKRNVSMKTSDAYKNYTIESAYGENGFDQDLDMSYRKCTGVWVDNRQDKLR